MFRSLRAKLLAWYSLVLVLVLATFTQVALWAVWRSNVSDVDQRLGAAASQLARAVAPASTGGYEINLVGDLAELRAGNDAPYYAVWTAAGTLIDKSDPDIAPSFSATPGARTVGSNREVVVVGADGIIVLVGQSLAQRRSDLWRTALGFVAAGGAALLLALLGGWFLVGRALTPIARIAETAEAMSESNLGLRVDINRTEDELGTVAAALNRAFDRLQDAFERQTRFTADASHELRTPLATLLAELEWALARPRGDQEYRESLQTCARAGERMRSVIEGLLTLARADVGAGPARREPVNLAALVREAADAASATPTANERRVAIELDGIPVATIAGDPDRLRELISNLLMNAVHYSTPGGTVKCSVVAVNGRTRLEVADSGPGIDPQDLPHIFERFYRANRARSGPGGGAGLGLAISKWIAESHGGEIRCESDGTGTRFSVEFPALAIP